ncbi:YqjF family protein [Haloferacaceae archaeon DSL9]
MVLSLEMGWRHPLFLSWPVDGAVLSAHLPDGLEPDTYDGSAWLSVVPYANVRIRPRRFPARLGLPLPELNLRTYVACDGEPGVYFFSLDAQGIASVLGARVLQHLPYYYARTSIDRRDDGTVRFESRRLHPGARPVHYAATYRPTGDVFPARTDPLAAFIVERYRLYTESPSGTIRYADIDHEPWTLYPAAVDVEENTLFRANGFEAPDGDPVCYYSPGVDAVASRSKRWNKRRAGRR